VCSASCLGILHVVAAGRVCWINIIHNMIFKLVKRSSGSVITGPSRGSVCWEIMPRLFSALLFHLSHSTMLDYRLINPSTRRYNVTAIQKLNQRHVLSVIPCQGIKLSFPALKRIEKTSTHLPLLTPC
jgi:hypothetical protein